MFCAKLQILRGVVCAGVRSRAGGFHAGGLGDLSICALNSHCRFSVNFAEKSSAKSATVFAFWNELVTSYFCRVGLTVLLEGGNVPSVPGFEDREVPP